MIKKIYDKLNTLPVWLSYVVAIISCFVAAIPSIIQFDSVIASTVEMYGLADSSIGDYMLSMSPAVKYLSAILGALVNFGILELVSVAVYSLFIRTSSMGRGRGYYAVSVRYTYSVYKLIIGLFSLTAVYAPAIYNYGYGILNFVVLVALFTICYLGIKAEAINDLLVFSIYSRLFNIFFIFEGVVNLFEFMLTLLDSSTKIADKVISAVMLALVAGAFAILYFTVYKKLKKEQSDAKNNFIPPEPPKNDDSEIFRGYGV